MRRYRTAMAAAAFAAVLWTGTGPASGAEPLQKANLEKMLKEAVAAVPQVGAAEAKKLIAAEKNLLLLDVREPSEVQKGKIAGSVNLPRGIVEFKILEQAKELDRPILVYCATGKRSALAAQSLVRLGYTNVKNLSGGYVAWAKAEKGGN